MPGLFTREQRDSFTKITDKKKWHPWYQPRGLRTWTLEAYDGGTLVHMYDTGEPDNYTKYLKFIIGLRKKGYDLTYDDMDFFKKSPFYDESYLSWVQRHHVIAASALCNYDEAYLNDLKNKSREEKEMFGWNMGFKESELNQIIDKFG